MPGRYGSRKGSGMEKYIIFYYVLINAAAFFLFASDKRRAVRQKWRIPERTLLLSAFLGGGAGALLAMQICRHKTKKKRFTILVPLFLLLHPAVWFLILHM